jgi:hypothetical protein
LVAEKKSESGSFEMMLSPGSYELEIAVDGAYLHPLAAMIGEEGGLFVVHTVEPAFDPDAVWVQFQEGVSAPRQAEILAAAGFEKVSDIAPFVLVVRTADQHLQVLLESMHAAYATELVPVHGFLDYECAAVQ